MAMAGKVWPSPSLMDFVPVVRDGIRRRYRSRVPTSGAGALMTMTEAMRSHVTSGQVDMGSKAIWNGSRPPVRPSAQLRHSSAIRRFASRTMVTSSTSDEPATFSADAETFTGKMALP
nr:unnamed protein product [Digitaria exilis]